MFIIIISSSSSSNKHDNKTNNNDNNNNDNKPRDAVDGGGGEELLDILRESDVDVTAYFTDTGDMNYKYDHKQIPNRHFGGTNVNRCRSQSISPGVPPAPNTKLVCESRAS